MSTSILFRDVSTKITSTICTISHEHCPIPRMHEQVILKGLAYNCLAVEHIPIDEIVNVYLSLVHEPYYGWNR